MHWSYDNLVTQDGENLVSDETAHGGEFYLNNTNLTIPTNTSDLTNILKWEMVVYDNYQHGSGGANTIVQRALARTGKTASTVTDQELISAIYAERGKKNASGNLHYFRNSTSGVQNSVANRFIQEEKDALANSTRTLNRELAATSTASTKGFYTG